MYPIGLRAHDFGLHPTIGDMARHIASFVKPVSVHLAPRRCIANAPDPLSYDEAYAKKMQMDLAAEGVSIAILGCHINPIHPDKKDRKSDLERFCASLRFSKAFGTNLVATESGSANADCSYTPETYEPCWFDALCESTSLLVEEASRSDVVACYEGGMHALNTHMRLERILREFPSPHFGLLYDPVNLVPFTGIPEKDGSVRRKPSLDAQKRFVSDALDRFGDRIMAMHVKDYRMEENGLKSGGIPAGKGVLDWSLIFRLLEEYKIHVPMMLENCGEADVKFSLEYLASCQP